MNNSASIPQSKFNSSVDLVTVKSPWLRRLYSLPISSKTNLIPWFSFGGLFIVLSLGGVWLDRTLKSQLAEQTNSQLGTKERVVQVLLADNLAKNAEANTVAQAVAALATEDGYTAIYWQQADGKLTLAASSNDAPADAQIAQLAMSSKGQIVERTVQIDDRAYALAAKTISGSAGEIGVIVHGSSLQTVSKVVSSSLLAHSVLGITILIIIIGLSKVLGKAIAEPIQNLQTIAQNFADGDLKTRAAVDTTDEVGLLGSTFNILADSIEINEARLKQEAQRSRLLKEIALEISEAADTNQIRQTAVARSRNVLNADRVIYLSLDADWQGQVIAEAVDSKYPVSLNTQFKDPSFDSGYAEQYQKGKAKAIVNIYQEGWDESQLKRIEFLAAISSLAAPVITNEVLTGLLIAYQCDQPRAWQVDEMELLTQIADQVGNTLEKAELLEKQRRAEQQERIARETLQRRAFELLMEVDPVSQGDLTVQVKVQEDEIGTIADSYNATIENLRKLVEQVQTAAAQVSTTTSDKDLSIQELSTDASTQTREINQALARIQGMTNSIQAVAGNAKAAEAAVLKASQTVQAGDEAMNQTVAGFQEIRDTVAETAKKVKRLGESSQKISKVVNVISSFADQTNLLALNASIEAAHAGEEGRGFAVVADEVRSLARQSAEATAEIEALVAEIQSETNEVVAAMESGTEQVVAGTKLVDKTRHSLIEIAGVSKEIDRLVGEIATATIEQSEDSEIVSQTMIQVASISNKTAAGAGEVSASFKDLLTVAQELQSSVAQFKVN